MLLLGLPAPLVELNRGRHDVLGGQPRGAPAAIRLIRSLEMTTRADALARIEAKLAAARDRKTVHPAWELVRATAWAGSAYVARVLEANDAWSILKRAAGIARAKYATWDAYGADFVAGRRAFQGKAGTGRDSEQAAVARLLDEWTSPWRVEPWAGALRPGTPAVHVPRTIRVGARGDVRTIREALAVAVRGDVIEIAGGTYREHLAPAADVSLVARGRVTVTTDREHALAVDGVGVHASGITWISRARERSAITVRGGGVLQLEGGTVRAASTGITVVDTATLAFVRDTSVAATGGFGIGVTDGGWLRAERTTVRGAGRSGFSIERRAQATLVDCAVIGAREVGILVVERGTATVTGGSVARSRWANAQLSAGTLTLADCALTGGQTGVFAHAGTVTLLDVAIAKPSRNGIEVAARGHAVARGVRITGARTGALVTGGTLALTESRIAGTPALWVARGGAASLMRSTVATRATTVEPGGALTRVDAAHARAALPFALIAHARTYSLTADGTTIKQLTRRRLSGHDYTARVERLLAPDRAFRAKLAFDPEAGLFSAVSTDRDALVELARRLRTR